MGCKSIIHYKILHKRESILIVLCLISYFIWILLFQNVIYKPRHSVPFIPFILMIFCFGFSTIKKKNIRYLISVPLLIFLIPITSILVWQHMYPTAISQFKSSVVSSNYKDKVVYAPILVNKYIKEHKNTSDILFVNRSNYKDLKRLYNLGYTIYSTVDLNKKSYYNQLESYSFYHNPYVNRLWSNMNLYIYKSSK